MIKVEIYMSYGKPWLPTCRCPNTECNEEIFIADYTPRLCGWCRCELPNITVMALEDRLGMPRNSQVMDYHFGEDYD